jgi:hypothetical protein
MGCSLLLVGCGKMGSAMLDGWLASRIVDQVVVVEPQGAFLADAGSGSQRIIRCAGVSRIPAGFEPDVVVLAVKPQVMDEVVPGYAGFARPGTVFLSIAAGKTIDYFMARLGGDAAIVRAMPNTPASVGRGMTVAVPNAAVTPDQRRLCETLLSAVGQDAWVEDESLIDAGTGLCLPFDRDACQGRRRRRPAGRTCDDDRQSHRRRQRRVGDPVSRARHGAPQERDQPQRYDPGGPGGPDGGGRHSAPVRPRHRRRDRPLARTGGLSRRFNRRFTGVGPQGLAHGEIHAPGSPCAVAEG